MEDPSKFFNVVIDKTNQRLNSFQAQVIVLESQLQMALDECESLKTQLKSFVKSDDGGLNFLRDQNETLLQEIRRLNAEVANLSASR
jgi:DNA anti-recombination protein RmuC